MGYRDENDRRRYSEPQGGREWERTREHENHGRSKFTPTGNQQDFGPGSRYGQDGGYDTQRGYGSGGSWGTATGGRDPDHSYGRGPGSSAGLGNVSDFDRRNESRSSPYGSTTRHRDPHYHQWREEQIRHLDNEYEAYRQERYTQFSEDFNAWRRKRQGLGPTDTQEMQSDADVAEANRQIQQDNGAARARK
jgi:hypothetical protein